ncbi:MAG: hypothetical protein J6V90_03830 [Treponema sp.]|nr:hypothetical protein [Treponema sp.]
MKIIEKIALGVCALALCGGTFFSCSNASDSPSAVDLVKTGYTGEQNSTASNDVVLFEDSEGWTTDWDTKTFEAAKFVDAVAGSQIKFTVRKNTDQYRTGTEGNYDYSNCYSLIQLLDGGNKLTGGTIEGGEIETAGGNLKPLYKKTDGTDDYDESHVFTMVYTPSAAEIDILKTKGVGIQAHGTRILKIEFIPTAATTTQQPQTTNGGEQTQTTNGGEQTQTSGGQETATVVWTGTELIGWTINESGVYIDVSNDKLVNAKGIRVTYTTGNGESHCLKFLEGTNWQDIALGSVNGAGTLADSGQDAGKAVWLQNNTTDAVVSIYWISGSTDETNVLAGGIKVYGDGATLTKIEVLK